MSYVPLVYGTLFFIFALSLHVLLWRLLRPVKDVLSLFILFAIVPLFSIALLYLPHSPFFNLRPYGIIELTGALLCYCALYCAYIMTYPALQARCPSLRMVLLIKRAGGAGIKLEEVRAGFDTADLVTNRLDDLISSGLVIKDKGVAGGASAIAYRVTPRGSLLLRPFMLFRRFLGLAPGEG